jgi:hypothetical protein
MSESHFRLGTPNHAGLTRSERVMHGYGTPEDLAWLADQNRLHQEWKNSPEGQAWLNSQPWYKPLNTPLVGLPTMAH